MFLRPISAKPSSNRASRRKAGVPPQKGGALFALIGRYALVTPSTCPDFNSGRPILVESPYLRAIRPAYAILSRSNYGTESSTRSFLARVGCFFSIPSRWSALCFHPSTGRCSYHAPHNVLPAYEFLLVRPIASLNFEGSKNTVVSTDGKESHGCDRWGMVVQERRSSTESARARRALG